MKFTNYIKLKETQQAAPAGNPPPVQPAAAVQPGQNPAQAATNNQAKTGQQQGQAAQPVDPKAQQAVKAATDAAQQATTTLDQNLSELDKAKQLNPKIKAAFLALKKLMGIK